MYMYNIYIYVYVYIYIYMYIYIYIYIYICPLCIYIYINGGVEHSGEGIVGRRLRNAKLFERIEHSGSREGIKKTLLLLNKYLKNSFANVVRLVAVRSET